MQIQRCGGVGSVLSKALKHAQKNQNDFHTGTVFDFSKPAQPGGFPAGVKGKAAYLGATQGGMYICKILESNSPAAEPGSQIHLSKGEIIVVQPTAEASKEDQMKKQAELEHIEKRVEDDRDDKSQAPFDQVIETVLQEDERANRKGNDAAHNLTEKNLREHDTKAKNADLQGITERRLDSASKDPYPHRNEEAYRRAGEKRPVNALDEEMGDAGDDLKRGRYEEASKKAQTEPKRPVDKDIGKQLTLDHPKKAFNLKKTKLGTVTAACDGYLKYKDSEPSGWDKFAAVRAIDQQMADIMSASRALSEDEARKIDSLKARKSEMLGIRLAQRDGVKLNASERNEASKAIHAATKNPYWKNLWDPFTGISEALSPLGLVVEDMMLTSSDTAAGSGGKIFDLAKNGQQVANAALHVSWHKMESGNWEVVAYLT